MVQRKKWTILRRSSLITDGSFKSVGMSWRILPRKNVASQTNIRFLALMSGLLVCAVLFGWLASTANPVMIGLGVGLVGGVFLLLAPKATIWLVLSLGLSSGALLSLGGQGLDKVSWAIALMAFLLWLPALMKLLRSPDVPLFVWLALVFVLQASFSTLLEWSSAGEFIVGFKRYFQMLGLMLAFATLSITSLDFQRWLKLLLGIALLQLPFAIYERFVLVPQRGPSAEAMDVVAGTLGANLQGGSPNSVMALLVLLAFVFVLMRWRAGLLSTWKFAVAGLILLAPLTLGETKIVVVMIPLMGVVALRREFYTNPFRFLPAFIVLGLMTVAMAYVYVFFILDSTFSDVIKATLKYNAGTQGYGSLYLNRSSVVSFWWSLQGLHDPLGFLFGHGLGSSYGISGSAGHIAARYPMYGIGLTTISTLLWDVGMLGFVLYTSVFVAAWRAANRLWKSTRSQVVRADLLAIQSAIASFFLFSLYSDSQVNLLPMELIVATVIGYLAFLLRQNKADLVLAARVTQ